MLAVELVGVGKAGDGNNSNTSRYATRGGISSFGSYTVPLDVSEYLVSDDTTRSLNNQGAIYSDRTSFSTIRGGGAGGSIYPSGTVKTTVGTSKFHGNGGAPFYYSGFYNSNAVGGDGYFPGGGGGAVNMDATNGGVTATGGNGANGVVRVWCW